MKLRKPGPAISIFFIPGFLLKSSTKSWATSRGFLPAGLATIKAMLLEKSPCSLLFGLSILISGMTLTSSFWEAINDSRLSLIVFDSSSGVMF